MSHETFPPTPATKAGSTPAHEDGAPVELAKDDAEEERVDPDRTVPDEAAERAVERERIDAGRAEFAREPDEDQDREDGEDRQDRAG